MTYRGSQLFSQFATDYSIPLDQLNFVIGQVIAFVCGLLFRKFLKPCPENTFLRHFWSFFIGLLISFFCYGPQIIHLIIESVLSYIALITLPRKYVNLVLFVCLMVHLNLLHLYQMVYFYGIYQIEITGALMIFTQKLSSLAFFYHDGMKKNEDLSETQRKNSLKSLPNIVEFFGYVYCFQLVLIGPLIFFNDYKDFITGDSILKSQQNLKINDKENGKLNGTYYKIQPQQGHVKQPNNKKVLIKKFLGLLILIYLYFNFTLVYHPTRNLENKMLSAPFWYRFIYMNISALCQRSKYYLAWQIADLVCNASGLGFNGYDENGKAKWNLCTNVNIIQLETSTSIKHFIDNWNISTQRWIRAVAYERLPKGRTLAAFVLSAMWHGFYPGYYCTFVSGAIFVYAGRVIRQYVRPIFQINDYTKSLYALITWIGTIASINYMALPFVLLGLKHSLQFYSVWYWSVHLIAIACIIIFPYKKRSNGIQTRRK